MGVGEGVHARLQRKARGEKGRRPGSKGSHATGIDCDLLRTGPTVLVCDQTEKERRQGGKGSHENGPNGWYEIARIDSSLQPPNREQTLRRWLSILVPRFVHCAHAVFLSAKPFIPNRGAAQKIHVRQDVSPPRIEAPGPKSEHAAHVCARCSRWRVVANE